MEECKKLQLDYLCLLNLPEDFIKEHKENINWDLISKNSKLSESFIKEFEFYVNWDYIWQYQVLSEEFIERLIPNNQLYNTLYITYLYLYCLYNNISINSYVNPKINWQLISQYQVLSESFIKKYKNDVYWDLILQYQTISEKFILEIHDIIFIKEYFINQKDSCDINNIECGICLEDFQILKILTACTICNNGVHLHCWLKYIRIFPDKLCIYCRK